MGALRVEGISNEGKVVLSREFNKTSGHFSEQLELEKAEGVVFIRMSLSEYTAIRKVVVK